jgi:hypothetical protein
MLATVQTTIDCVLTIEEVEGGKCQQTLEGDVTIGIPGLGRIAERIICSSLRDVYTGIPEIVERCVGVPPSNRLAVHACPSAKHASPLDQGSCVLQVEFVSG